MNRLLPLSLLFVFAILKAQLPAGGQWGCPSIPVYSDFDTTCFKRTGEIKLGQGYFDHYGSSDPVYLVIPQNRPSFAISIAVAWDYYRNVLGRDGMSINQWFATMGQENGFATYQGVLLPATIYDVEVGGNVGIPCQYPRGCNNNSCAGAGYCWHVGQNGQDGPYHNTAAGYQTISPYVPARYPGPVSTYHPLFNSAMERAAMNKTFYDLSIYRRAQMMNSVDLATVEAASPDPYGVEAAQALAYNLGPNAANAISVPGYTLPAGIATNNNWAANYYSGGVSCYAERVASMTAVLDNNEAYATSHFPGGCGSASNWDFYSFYDSQIKWDTVLASINRLLVMYPEIDGNAPAKAAYIAAVQTAFNRVDANLDGQLSFRYEMGSVIDAIVMNLPKDDPGFNAQYAINGTGCKLDCRAPYTNIQPLGPTTICSGQTVILKANVDSPTPSTTYQWYRDGVAIAGATTDVYNATLAGTYSIITCWSANRESNGTATTCCSEPECKVTVVVQGSCSNCAIGISLTPTSNSCTGMPNGSILATASGVTGPYDYIITGPAPSTTTTTVASASTTNNFAGLRDGKYTIQIRKQSDHLCRAIQDVFITPTTIIKETLSVTQVPASCATQLNATLINQQPNTCNLTVSYGSLNAQSWDRSFFMDLKANGSSVLTMFESYPSAGTRDDPWDWWPFSWPAGGGTNAPNVKTISVNDGDTLTAFGTVIIPQGIAAPGFIDGGIRLDGATFTNLTTSATTSFFTSRYQSPAPVPGTRQMGSSYRVTCPVVSPPAYTYAWTPTTGLNNSTISNPVSSVSANTTYTVTATHPGNTSCKLTGSITVAANCAALPVEWLHVSAVKEGARIKINWTVFNEENCARYIVEKSTDGIHFFYLSEQSCQGSKGITDYDAYDANPGSSVVYYRIIERDYNGRMMQSEIVSVNINQWWASVQPNPFENTTTIHIYGTDAFTAAVYDLSGRVLSLRNSTEESIEIGAGLASGIYIVELTSGQEKRTYKIVKR